MTFQVTAPMAVVRADQRRARAGQLQGHGLQHRSAVRHAALRHPQHSLLQVEDEQGPGLHHVPTILCLRGCQLRPRVWILTLSERISRRAIAMSSEVSSE